jgi:hypothetical protein
MGITRTVGSGRDHSTIQAAIDYFNSYDFSSNGGGPSYIDIYPEGGGSNGEWVITATLTGPTSATNVSSTNYLVIRAVAGSSFKDHANKLTNALRYNTANGVAIRCTASVPVFNIGINNTEISGLQVQAAASSHVEAPSGITSITIKNCIFKGNAGGNAGFSNVSFGSGNGHRLVNNLFYDCNVLFASNGFGYIIGNTIYAVGDSANNRGGLRIDWGDCLCIDNIVYSDGSNGDIYRPNGGTFQSGSGYCATGDTSGPTTGAVNSLTMSDLFESVTGGSEDFRIKSTAPSSVKTGGTRRQTETGDLDIVETSRSTVTPTIGAWESPSGQAQAPRSVSMFARRRR